ncbi:MAG: alcohol dehydrogenase [Spirochaetia bacterium]|nr:alcohol dehydrogenase [Spirochaetia bacterium]
MLRKVHKINKAGDIRNLKLVTDELAFPSDNEVTIEIYSIGLNFADVFALTGLYSATPKGSFIPGLEFSGKVHSLGKNVTKYSIGEKVMGVTRFGAYSDYINIDQRYIYTMPKSWNFSEGAGFIAQALTAYYALSSLGALKKNQTVLIHSAAGGVGILANRIAKKLGAYTIGSVGDTNKISILKSEGYDGYIVRSNNFYKDLQSSLQGRDLNLVLECIGGQIFKDSYKLLASGGRLITYGSANFTPEKSHPNWINVIQNYLLRPKLDPLSMTSQNKSVMGFNLIWMWDKIEELSGLLKEVLALELKPQLIGNEFPFEDAKGALNYFKSGKSIGKVILKVRP